MYVIGRSIAVPCYHGAVIRTLFAVSLALLAFAAACGSGSSSKNNGLTTPGVGASPEDAAGCSPARASAPGDVDQSIITGGSSRTYVLHIPTGYDGAAPAPLVLAFHGYSLNGRQMADYTGLANLADERGFVLVAPDGAGTPAAWNWRKSAAAPDDVRFVGDLLTKLSAELCVDADRVFAAGFSDGAAMSRVLACDMADRLAAVAVVASPGVPCVAAVPMIAFHGTSDPLVPFEGGTVPAAVAGGGTFPPVRRSVSEWARALGCDGLPTISRPTATVELSTFLRCSRGDGDALLYTLLGGGHTWPGSVPLPAEQYGATNPDINASATIWEFFAAHPRVH